MTAVEHAGHFFFSTARTYHDDNIMMNPTGLGRTKEAVPY